MQPKKLPKFDKYASPTWKPVAGLAKRKPGMAFTDRIYHWLISLGGLAMVGAGVAVMAYLQSGKAGGWLIGMGFVVFVLGFPSQAARNGYRTL